MHIDIVTFRMLVFGTVAKSRALSGTEGILDGMASKGKELAAQKQEELASSYRATSGHIFHSSSTSSATHVHCDAFALCSHACPTC